MYECQFIHSFIPAISIAPLKVLYYSEALPTTARILYRSFTPVAPDQCYYHLRWLLLLFLIGVAATSVQFDCCCTLVFDYHLLGVTTSFVWCYCSLKFGVYTTSDLSYYNFVLVLILLDICVVSSVVGITLCSCRQQF